MNNLTNGKFSVIRQNLRKENLCALWTERRLKDLDPINDDAMYLEIMTDKSLIYEGKVTPLLLSSVQRVVFLELHIVLEME